MSSIRPETPVDALPYPDVLYARGAEGWLDLGNADEASRELHRIAPERRGHPEVLALRWNIGVKARKWDDCIEVATLVTDSYPNDPCGWIALAQTLYFTRRIAEAYEIAIAKVEEFPDFWPLAYDAACYSCLLGKQTEAARYLRLAMTVGNAKAVKQRALKDPDLKALWVNE